MTEAQTRERKIKEATAQLERLQCTPEQIARHVEPSANRKGFGRD